jgi:hypothetical protein
MTKWAALLAAVAALALAPSAGATTHVKSGEIVVGQGAAGVNLGMTRAQVRSLLGRPFYSNANGFMQYAPDSATNIFDVYLGSTSRVRQLVIAGGRFKIGEISVFARGSLRKLKAVYGKRLKAVRGETGDPMYRIRSRYRGWTVWTDFLVTKHSLDTRPLDVFILFPYH